MRRGERCAQLVGLSSEAQVACGRAGLSGSGRRAASDAVAEAGEARSVHSEIEIEPAHTEVSTALVVLIPQLCAWARLERV